MPWRKRCPLGRAAALLPLVLLLAATAQAQERGFALSRLDVASVGSAGFLVERPWYSSTRYFAVGVTGDYALNPLVPSLATGRGELQPIVAHAVIGHVELAGALFDRVQLNASLPLTVFELGAPELVSQAAPLSGIGLGDPRIGLLVRIAGQAERDPFSLHVGVSGWVPLGNAATHQGDPAVRLMPRLVLAGAIGEAGRWALDGALLVRPYSSLGPPALGLTSSSEARVGASLGLALLDGRLTLGPEARFSTQVVGVNAFAPAGMSLELLGGVNLWLFDTLQLGLAGGAGFLGAAGTPDARGVVRLAFAPRRSEPKPEQPRVEVPKDEPVDAEDPDGDRVATSLDRCPYEPETFNGIRDEDGCPELVLLDHAGLARVLSRAGLEEREPRREGTRPPAAPALDGGRSESRLDAQADARDQGRTNVPAAGHTGSEVDAQANARAGVGADEPDGGRTGGTGVAASSSGGREAVFELDAGAVTFATSDADGDGVLDVEDRCPVTKEDTDGFEDEDGCPEVDNDDDAVSDLADRCPLAAETLNGIDDADGCPDQAPDADRDGIADTADRCPLEPETEDGVRDDDGCPEAQAEAPALAKLLSASTVPGLAVPVTAEALGPALRPETDSDGDGVSDGVDRCPVTPEDRDAFEDEDGCPEADNDDDGLADANDRCPLEGETINGWEDEDGCPDLHQDLDGDGLEYAKDRCPEEPGDASDGCPHAPLPALALPGFPGAPSEARAAERTEAPPADLDADGVPDVEDACPMSREDVDTFEDDDGCPEPDNDHDGVADASDKCPLVAETINGVKDEDGCPDVGASKVSIQAGAVVIRGVVRFQSGSANLTPASLPLLREVAATLKAASTLSIEIRGHTDDVGNAAKNIKLSQRRSETIRAVLIKAGVAPTRLVATGFGPTKPVASNKTAAGREQNRRVEFLILGESK